MSDQADGLRQLVRARVLGLGTALVEDATPERPALATASALPTRTARCLVFTSGKGGVGTSNLTLNLAIALAAYGQRVVVVDADLGLANLDLLCGLQASRSDLGRVLAEGRSLAEAVIDAPGPIRLLVGWHQGSRAVPDLIADAPSRILAELVDLEADADYLLIDAGSGLGATPSALASVADQVVLVATPEPTALADATAALRRLAFQSHDGRRPVWRLVVNQTATPAEGRDCLDALAASCRESIGIDVSPLGQVRSDPQVRWAVKTGRPFAIAHPHGAAARGVRRLARRLLEERRTPKGGPRPSVFGSLARALRSGGVPV